MDGTQEVQAPRRVAIAIGQNHFPNAAHLTDLAYAEADMTAIAELLKSEPGRPYDDVVTIPTGTHYEALERIEQVVSELRHDDTIMVYYSGHGVRDRRRRLYLAFENTNEERLSSTALKVGTLLDLLQSHDARRRILVLDCCYAGAVGAEFDRSGLPEQVANEVHGAGTVVLTAATKVEIAKESPEHGHGIFTRHFLDALAGAADHDGDGIITSEELFHYVHDKVTAETSQKPQRFNHEIEGKIVLRETGLTPWKDKTTRIRENLLILAKQGQLSDRLLTEALQIAIKPPSSFSPGERKLFHMLEGIDPDDFRPGQFANDWDVQMAALGAEAAKPPNAPIPPERIAAPPPEPEPAPVSKAKTKEPEPATGMAEAAAEWTARPEPDAPQPAATARGIEPGLVQTMGAEPQRVGPAMATFQLIVFVVVGFYLGGGDPLVIFDDYVVMGLFLTIWGGLGFFVPYTKWVGDARWRKWVYWIAGVFFALAGMGWMVDPTPL